MATQSISSSLAVETGHSPVESPTTNTDQSANTAQQQSQVVVDGFMLERYIAESCRTELPFADVLMRSNK
ncbi:hypothetical protein VFPPC_02316 [Pochonia chlamydosporia 170]|uniref:Uncharacterized protein n=1 Tax=Pochonia chlamydosporia 170 TaxID=1380566 RepID=A0A179FWI1_METCM|nr:hypothetical protein VFPPC_02316 [Pochonia chlamydosporia 170]OAQ69727.2 hypothetical protein VFPPC_02316 [Pochonia chlamydosporia 170]